jgi:hypothetical protein
MKMISVIYFIIFVYDNINSSGILWLSMNPLITNNWNYFQNKYTVQSIHFQQSNGVHLYFLKHAVY